MEAIVIIALFALWVNPLIGLLINIEIDKRPDQKKKYVLLSVGTITIIGLALFTGISTASLYVDYFLLGLLYLAICVLLWIGASLNDKPVSILSIVLMVIVFGSGYLLGTIGMLILGIGVAESEPSRTVRINNSTLYREYNLGFVTSSWGGSEVALFTSFRWFPFVEREFFSKKYVGDLYKSNPGKSERFTTPDNSRVNTTPSFYGTDFKLTYDTTKNELILSYGSKRDTLYLDR